MGATEPTHAFQPVRAKRTSDAAVEQIVALVRSGSLEPGAKLPAERTLTELLQVSRGSLREAIFVLQTMGLLRVVRGHGTWVREDAALSLSDDWYQWMLDHAHHLGEMLEMYEVLDARLAGLAAERATPEDVETLERCLTQMERAVDEGDYEALVAADDAFHTRLRAASRNTVMTRVLHDLDNHVLDVRRAVLALPRKPGRIVTEHRLVVDAVAARDAKGAARQLRNQIRRARDEVLAAAGVATGQR